MRVCIVEGCEKPHQARGWCTTHYQQWRRFVVKAQKPRHTTVEAKVLDILTLDGGWLTAEGVQLETGGAVTTVKTALRSLASRGLVVSRVVDLAHMSTAGGFIDRRTEWSSK